MQCESTATRTKKKRKKPQDTSKLYRDGQVKIRLTKEEIALLKNTAGKAGVCMADYIMACVRNKPIVRIPGAAHIRTELLREGRNLNQLLYIAHGDRKVGKEIEWQSIYRAIRKVETNLDMLSELISKWDVDIAEQVKCENVMQEGENSADCKM